jgi:hypothetical protein
MLIERILGKWQLVPLHFMQAAVADGQSAVAMYTAEDASHVLTNIGYTMPFAGEIIGVSLNLSAAATTGHIHLWPTIAGTAVTTPTVSVTTAVYGSSKCPRGTNKFAKNAVIGCKLTSEGTWDGTTSDLLVTVWVLMKIEGI